jgi:hypothetical protein
MLQRLERLLAVARRRHDIACLPERESEGQADRRFVVDR